MHRLLTYPGRTGNSPAPQVIAQMYERLRTDEHRRHVEHLIADLLRIEEQGAERGKPARGEGA